MASPDVSTCADAIRDYLETLTFGSGINAYPVGVVYTYQPLLRNPQTFHRAFQIGNPTRTVWLVLWGPTAGNWVDTPASTIQRNHSWIVRAFRPLTMGQGDLTGDEVETDHFAWTDLIDHVHRKLAIESFVGLGLTPVCVQVGPWSITSRDTTNVMGVPCFASTFEAPMENFPEVPT